jgi:hypothetical protein
MGTNAFHEGGHASRLAPEKRQGILTMLTVRGEFPEAAQEAPAAQGSFDFGTASLREAVPSLRMTELDDKAGLQS